MNRLRQNTHAAPTGNIMKGCDTAIGQKFHVNTIFLEFSSIIRQSYFTSKTFYFQNSPKNLDLSYKMDSRSLGLFRKGKTRIIAKFQRMI